jgi:ADP-heptose:LPS heptosyltransferase
MRTLIISWHGLGDNIMLTPVLRKYKEVTNEEIYLAHLARLPVQDVLAECPDIGGFHTITDVWNDYPDVEVGREAVWKEARNIAIEHGYDAVKEITMAPSLGITHKMLRAAHELGVELEDYQTMIWPAITPEIIEQADEFFDRVHTPATFVAAKAGNPPKDIPSNVLQQMLGTIPPENLIEYETRNLIANHLPLGNIPLEMEILRRCAHCISADSFMMHAAASMLVPTTAVFLSTPPEWVIPLHKTQFIILAKI